MDDDTAAERIRTATARLSMGMWKKISEPDVRAPWLALHGRLTASAEKDPETCLGYLYHYVVLYNAGQRDSHPADIRTLSGARDDAERACQCWTAMVAAWNAKHVAKVRTHLSRALLCHVPALAHLLNPTLRAHHRTVYEVERSYHRRFTLHDCLPVRVRRLTSRHVEYTVLSRVVDETVMHLRSVSKGHVQRLSLFMDALLHAGGGLHWEDGDRDEGGRWQFMRAKKPMFWLQRFEELFRDRPRVTFEHFKRQIRYIQLLHAKVLNPAAKLSIPIPVASVRLRQCREVLAELSSTAGSLSAASSEIDDDALREERQRLRETVSILKSEMCVRTDDVEEANRTYAFDPSEIRRIFEACATVRERLVASLFFTTGLRIGGVCRLRWARSVTLGPPVHGRAVPVEISTVEKGGKLRTVRLTDTVRILIARWYNEGRGGAGTTSAYLFPGARSPDEPTSSRHMWQVCRGIFDRAGLSGAHVHPHTTRHTVIQMLYLTGMKFEAIAKWIGHAHPSITSNVYGRLAQRDIQLTGVPFAATEDASENTEQWKRIARYVHCPFTFDDDEWCGLKRPAADEAPGPKRRAISRATDVLGGGEAAAADGAALLQATIRGMIAEMLEKNNA